MTLRVAYWKYENRFVVEAYDDLGPIDIVWDGTTILLEEGGSTKAYPIEPERHKGFNFTYIMRNVKSESVPCFRVDEVDYKCLDGGLYELHLPEIRNLPWPVIRASRPITEDEAEEGLSKRLKDCRTIGQAHSVLRQVPYDVRKVLSGAKWKEVVDRAAPAGGWAK